MQNRGFPDGEGLKVEDWEGLKVEDYVNIDILLRCYLV
jgi:hypothetical protein